MHISKKRLGLAILAILILSFVGIQVFLHSHEDDVPVLNYHQINDRDHNALTVSSSEFAAQMQYLATEGYHTITPQELADSLENNTALPEKPIVITFDDGYLDNYQNAYPVLKEHNMKATIFLISDYVSTYPNYLTWSQIDEMQQSGLIDFESHTLSHIELPKASSEKEIEHQLKGARQALEWHLKKPVHFIAYPCGSYNDEVQELTQETGYRAAFTVKYGLDKPGMDMYALNRVPIFGGNSHTLLRFKLRIRFAPLLTFLSQYRNDLIKSNHPGLARFVPMP